MNQPIPTDDIDELIDEAESLETHQDSECEGFDYRVMSAIMTAAGWKMNHTSARNHTIRAMRHFAEAYIDFFDLDVEDQLITDLSKDPKFQLVVADVLQRAMLQR